MHLLLLFNYCSFVGVVKLLQFCCCCSFCFLFVFIIGVSFLIGCRDGKEIWSNFQRMLVGVLRRISCFFGVLLQLLVRFSLFWLWCLCFCELFLCVKFAVVFILLSLLLFYSLALVLFVLLLWYFYIVGVFVSAVFLLWLLSIFIVVACIIWCFSVCLFCLWCCIACNNLSTSNGNKHVHQC